MKIPVLGPLKVAWTPKLPQGRLRHLMAWSVILAQTAIILLLLSASLDTPSNQRQFKPACPGEKIQLSSDRKLTRQQLREILQTSQNETDVQLTDELPIQVPRDPPRVFFNRVPKCGSSALMALIKQLSRVNNFTFARARLLMSHRMNDTYQRQFTEHVVALGKDVLFERHLHYMNFSTYGLDQPVYINLVRDPLERMVSWYYYRRYQSKHSRLLKTPKRVRTFDECVLGNFSECVGLGKEDSEEGYFKIIPFFCGQEEFCREPSQKSLIQAMRNVKRSYAVVGITEEYSQFVLALEHVLPKYFKGATKLYSIFEAEWKNKFRTVYKLPISQEATAIMQDKLKLEYQFYHFLRHRFHNLMSYIEKPKMRGDGSSNS